MKKNEWFQIGEVSRLFHISIGLLRHYDSIGLLKPEYTDPDTGYRYYSTRQFECLNTIRYLRALDMPLDQIAVFLQNRDLDTIRALLLSQKEEVVRQMNKLLLIEKKITNRLSQIEDAAKAPLEKIRLVNDPELKIASIKKKIAPRNYLDLEYSIRELEQSEQDPVTFLGKVGVGLSTKKLQDHNFYPYDLVFLLPDPEDHFRGATSLIPAGKSVMIRFSGGHEKAAHYYEQLIHYIEKHKLKILGFSREVTLIDYGLTNDPSKFVTEIRIPVDTHQHSPYQSQK